LVVSQGSVSALAAIQAHLQECVGCQIELAAKLEADPQINSNVAARIKVLDPITSVGPSAPAHLLNMLSQGLHVRVCRLMLVGARIHVRSPLGHAFGNVRYCIPAGLGFQIGVKLEAAD